MLQWASVVGLAMTPTGVVLAFHLPVIGAPWAGPETEAQERRVQARVWVGLVLVLAGRALQMYAAWPSH